MPKNKPGKITRGQIAQELDENSIEYLLEEFMDPDDAADSGIRTVLRQLRRSLDTLHRLLELKDPSDYGSVDDDEVDEEDMDDDEDEDSSELGPDDDDKKEDIVE